MTARQRQLIRQRQKEFKPRLIFWEVTKGCNLRCIHCRATATELMSPSDLPTGKALEHHLADCRLRQPDPRAQRRRAALSSRHFPAGRIRHQPRAARRAGHERDAGDERHRGEDQACRHQARLDFAGRLRRRRHTIPSAEFRAHSMRRFTACAICRSWASRCRSTRRSRATTRTSCRRCSNWRAAWAQTRCTPSCWFRWAAE